MIVQNGCWYCEKNKITFKDKEHHDSVCTDCYPEIGEKKLKEIYQCKVGKQTWKTKAYHDLNCSDCRSIGIWIG